MLGPFLCCRPGSGVQLTEVCPAHKCTFFLLRVELPAHRAETEQLLWCLAAFSHSLWWWGPETAVIQPSPASIMQLILETAPHVLMWEDQSRWQEAEELVPVALVPTV